MEIQIRILQILQALRNDYLTAVFTAITMLAEETYVTVFLAVIYWCIDKVKGKRIAFFVLFNSIFNSVIKNIVQMPRPFEMGAVSPIRVETATGSSFPSGHTQTAVSFWMGIMYVLKTKASVILGIVMILLTAFSRMYLGVHWPMDVLGAILFGVIFTYFAGETLGEKAEISEKMVIISSLAVLVTLLFNVDRAVYKAVAAMWGLCLGGYIEQKYIRFKTAGTMAAQGYKVLIGLAGLLMIKGGMSSFLPDIKIIVMLKNALLLLWAMAGAPWIFSRLIKEKQ